LGSSPAASSEKSTPRAIQRKPYERARNAAIMLADASTPYPLNPRSVKACEIGTPVPHPKSRIVAPGASNWTTQPRPKLQHQNYSARARR
jgi:hypothetical protein